MLTTLLALPAANALITDPTWIFFLVLVIILFAPLLLRRLHIPPIIGLILAGILVVLSGAAVILLRSRIHHEGKTPKHAA